MSLGARLTALVVAAFTIGLVVVGLLVPSRVRDYLVDRLDDDLRGGGPAAALRALGDGNAPFEPPSAGALGALNPRVQGAYVEVRDRAGGVVVADWVDPDLGERAVPELPEAIDVAPRRGFTVGSVGPQEPARYRAMTFPVVRLRTGEPATLVVALPTTEVDQTVSEVRRVTIVIVAGTLVAVAALSWVLVRLGLRPLRRMERTAAAITTAGDLHQRIEHPGSRTELGALGTTLNEMLSRLEQSFSAQQASEARLRRFVGDASHELRTPLTSIRGYAELYRHGGDSVAQVERSMGRIEDEAARMSRLVDDLLLLARLDESPDLRPDSVDLAELLDGLVTDARAVEPARPFELRVVPCTIVGDRHRIAQAVANVLANARLHTPPGTPVEVSLAADGTDAVIEVVDHGPGLSVEDRGRVFDRFYRADRSRSRPSGGSGLGLAITAAIVGAHGGAIDVVDTPGGGATFRLRFPALPAPRVGVPVQRPP